MNNVKNEIRARKELIVSRVQQKEFKINPKKHSVQNIQKLLKIYPVLKKSRFLAEISKDQSTYASIEQIYNVIERCSLMLLQIQTETGMDRDSISFNKDRRVKALCRGVEELENVVTSLCKD